METKLNIAEILKNKPKGTKLYTDTFGELSIENVYTGNEFGITLLCKDGDDLSFYNDGRYSTYGEPILVPSREMRDWAKFSWKKGDVLVHKDGTVHIIFEGFEDDTYRTFKGKYYLWEDKGGHIEQLDNRQHNMETSSFIKANDDDTQTYINTIEKRLCGKFNCETLEVEKIQPEFKDGDIVALVVRKCTHIAIFQSRQEAYIGFHAVLCQNDELLLEEPFREDVGDIELRLATDSEKQQLFDALAKEGKRWDSEKKQIVDLKKKVKLKPFDKVLVRDFSKDKWGISFFGFKEKDNYVCINHSSWYQCIPYEGNEHLLGTTKDMGE